VSIEAPDALGLDLDGEAAESPRVRFEVLPGALQMLAHG
jgi:diacylglycerol kinase family enzyme